MKKIFKSVIFLLFAGMMSVNAQVNIGTGEDPLPGALLQLRENDEATGAANASKGLAFPRVKLTHAGELYPMFLKSPMQDYNETSNPANAEYTQKREELKKSHTGLVVYNVTDNSHGGLVPGLAQWDGTQWVSLKDPSAKALGNAVFESVNCYDIEVNSEYWEGDPLDLEYDALTLFLTVTTPGYYTITTDTVNGCWFSASGIAQERGETEILLGAHGTPTKGRDDPYQYHLHGANLVCGYIPIFVFEEEVAIPPQHGAGYANYNPTSLEVKGVYKKGKVLDNTNFIEITMDVVAAGNYDIYTNGRNGIKFKTSGSFPTTGKYTVRLQGEGKPLDYAQSTSYTITFDYNNGAIMAAEIEIEMSMKPEITYAVIGTNRNDAGLLSTYFWSRTPRHTALLSENNFGNKSNSTVQLDKLRLLWDEAPQQAAQYLDNGYPDPEDGGKLKQPDIVLYNTFGVDLADIQVNLLTEQLKDALVKYVKGKGCLIFGASNDIKVPWLLAIPPQTETNLQITNSMLREIYDQSLHVTPLPLTHCATSFCLVPLAPNVPDNVFQLKNDPNDPILKGPFANLAGKYFGEDNADDVYVPSGYLPQTAISICSAKNNFNYKDLDSDDSLIWYDTKYNIFFIGDSSGSTDKSKSEHGYPAYYSKQGAMLTKQYGPAGGTKQEIWNAHLEMNAVAWAINRALTNGINPH